MDQNTNQHQNNPLMQFSRRAEFFINLPSKGQFNNKEDIELAANGELGICPMTTLDEINMNMPDALLNGESLINVIKSCIPGIKNPRNMPSPDIDAILLGIRSVTYGDEMPYTVNCPKCEEETTFGMSLQHALSTMTFLEPDYNVTLSNNIIVHVKPHTMESNIKKALLSFNEGIALKTLIEDDLAEEDKIKKYKESFAKIVQLTIELAADSIVMVKNSDGTIIDSTNEQKKEWIENISRKDAEIILNKIEEINKIGINKKKDIECPKCEHKWETTINTDPTHFFG